MCTLRIGLFSSLVQTKSWSLLCWMGRACFMFTLTNWLSDLDSNSWAQCSTFPSTVATWRALVWTLSLFTSALSRMCTCLSLQINNKANVVTSPKEPVPTPSLVHCLPALLPACLHDCLFLSNYLSVHTFSSICPDYAALLNTTPFSLYCEWWLFFPIRLKDHKCLEWLCNMSCPHTLLDCFIALPHCCTWATFSFVVDDGCNGNAAAIALPLRLLSQCHRFQVFDVSQTGDAGFDLRLGFIVVECFLHPT